MKKTGISIRPLLFFLTVLVISFLSCNSKKDLISPTYEGVSRVDKQALVHRFLHESPSISEKAKQILADIKKIEAKHPFLAEYARRYGFPEWEYMFGSSISPGSRQSQKEIGLDNQVVSNSSSTANKSSGYFFIPLRDSMTKQVKGYIYCQQYNDSTFTYTTYDVQKILAFTPQNDTAKTNKFITLGVASYFEKQINGIEVTNEFKSGLYSNVQVKEISSASNGLNKTTESAIQVNALDITGCFTMNSYEIKFSGFTFILEIYTPCLPEVVVISTPKTLPPVGGGGGAPPVGMPTFPIPSLPPGGSGGGIGGGSYSPPANNNPDPVWGHPGYTLPPDFFSWDPVSRRPYDWSLGYPTLPRAGGYTPELQYLITTLGLNHAQAEWLNLKTLRVSEINNFLNRNYSHLSTLDKQAFAIAHINAMMSDIEYSEMIESYSNMISIGHPWMIELFKELAVEIGLKVIKKYLPGYGDWQSIKDAIDNVAHGDLLSALGEVLNIVKKKVPLLAAADAIIDIYDFEQLAAKAWKAFDKIKILPTNAFNSILKTIKNKCGGILDKIEHDYNIQGKIKYDPSDAFNFFKDIANDLGITYTPFTTPNGPGGTFDLPGGFTIKYYPVSSTINPATGIGYPTIEILSNNVTIYKFRFEL
jgi:hypothetical protein